MLVINGTEEHSPRSLPPHCLACKFILLFPETAPCTVRAPKMINNRQATLVSITIVTATEKRELGEKNNYKTLLSFSLKQSLFGALASFNSNY